MRGTVRRGRLTYSLEVAVIPEIFVVELSSCRIRDAHTESAITLLHRFNRPAGTWLFLAIPGTSCLATIVMSLRDKNHSPIEAPRIKSALMR
jgi:hypothetical protein